MQRNEMMMNSGIKGYGKGEAAEPEKDLFRRSPYQQMRGYAVVAGICVTLLFAQL